MEPVATVAAVLSIISAIFGIINGGQSACRQAGELLSDNGNRYGEKRLNKIMVLLLWVEQKLQEEVKRRTYSNCSETSIKADLLPLGGELAEARSLIIDWGNKDCLGKWCAAKQFEKKLEKSEEAIYQRLLEFSSYTDRYEATQAAKPAAKSIHLERLTYCTVNLNQDSIIIQPWDEHPLHQHTERGKVHPDHEGNPGRPQTQQAVSQEKKEFEDRVGKVIFIVCCLVLVVITIWTVIKK